MEPAGPPLTVVQRDYRPAGSPEQRERVRLLQWNIERGYKLPGIVAELQRLDADVIALQEVDVGCDRSGGADCGDVIARALGMCYAFVAEFDELRSPLRSAETQGGGQHGQAILSRWPLRDVRALVHRHQPVDWAAEGEARREPRRGKRVALAAIAELPAGPLLVYSLHLEVFTGITGRLLQFCDVLQDARLANQPAQQCIMGDMNTMAHSIARLSPLYCCDAFRWLSLGQTEARFWAHHVLEVTDAECVVGFDVEAAPARAPLRIAEGIANPRLAPYCLPPRLCEAAVNPGFVDPWCPDGGVTFDNAAYHGLMHGKLDWVLLRGPMRCVGKEMGNAEYALSDHKWLAVDLETTLV